MKNFILTLTLMCSMSFAGLDQHGSLDEVIAVYKFEDTLDSGPREFHNTSESAFRIVGNGQFGKCLSLSPNQRFGMFDDLFLGITGNFSIVGWVKTGRINNDDYLSILASGMDANGQFPYIGLKIKSDSILGWLYDGEGDAPSLIESENPKIYDRKWHHIGFSLAEDYYQLFIDGEQVFRERNDGYMGFVVNDTTIDIATTDNVSVLLDEIALFETGFSVYEISALYNSPNGIQGFLEAMPVDPQSFATTTWAAIKSGK